MNAWEQVALVAIPYVVPVIVALCVYLGKRLLEKLPSSQREEAARIVQVVVQAAEQSLPGASGADKKAAVCADLEAIFKQQHLSVPVELVDAFIESAVLALNDGQPPSGGNPPVVGFRSVPPTSPDLAPAA